MPQPRVAIIILNWNGLADTIDCLHSVAKIDYPNHEVIVVDNGSTDGSAPRLRELFPSLRLIETGRNLGFAEGNNVAIRPAVAEGFDFVLLLNNDTTVAPDFVTQLVAAAQRHPDGGIFGSKIYYHADPLRLWYAGTKFVGWSVSFSHLGCNDLDQGQFDEEKTTEYACGCAMLVRAEVVRRIGVMDARYFLLWEETDWCYQARAAGFGVWFVPTSKVWHKVSSSFQGGRRGAHWRYFMWRNRLLWMERNLHWRYALTLHRKHVSKLILREIAGALKPGGDPADRRLSRAALAGVRDYVLRRFGPAPAWVMRKPAT